MSFTIVSTKERNGIYYTAVPEAWVCNNVLYWPKLSNTEREALRSNQYSVPEKNVWTKYPCEIKCSKINSFEEALKLEKAISKCNDTEEEILQNTNKQTELQDRNDMFSVDPIIHLNPAPELALFPETTFLNSIQQSEVVQENSYLLDDSQVQVFDMAKLEKQIIDMKQEIISLKKEVKENHLKLNLFLEKIYDTINEKFDKFAQPHVTENGLCEESLLEKFNFPLKTVEEIELFNVELTNNINFKRELKKFMSKIGGTSGMSDGLKATYKLVDCIFSAEILINYTWTGISRNKTVDKIVFQKYTGILDVFLDVILMADNRFNKEKLVNCLRDNILKHAKKRSCRKKLNKQVEARVGAEDEARVGAEDEARVGAEEVNAEKNDMDMVE